MPLTSKIKWGVRKNRKPEYELKRFPYKDMYDLENNNQIESNAHPELMEAIDTLGRIETICLQYKIKDENELRVALKYYRDRNRIL